MLYSTEEEYVSGFDTYTQYLLEDIHGWSDFACGIYTPTLLLTECWNYVELSRSASDTMLELHNNSNVLYVNIHFKKPKMSFKSHFQIK